MAEFVEHFTCAPYVTVEELFGCCKVAADNLTEDDPRIEDAITDASLIVYYLTGRQFGGTCEATVRPPCLYGGCSCGCDPNQINLGFWPVTELSSIRIGGETLTGSGITDVFHVNEWHYLARNDGEPILSGNQYALPGSTQDSAEDGYVFEITLEHGLQVPRLITRAARALACELLTSCLDLPCKMPQRVTSVTRSGVTMDVVSVADLLRDGRTGIYEVDLAIATFNPSRMQSPAFVWSGQTAHGRRVNT